jgi:hypothetical protein
MSASFVQFSINFNGDFVELLADKKDERKLNFIIKKSKEASDEGNFILSTSLCALLIKRKLSHYDPKFQ